MMYVNSECAALHTKSHRPGGILRLRTYAVVGFGEQRLPKIFLFPLVVVMPKGHPATTTSGNK